MLDFEKKELEDKNKVMAIVRYENELARLNEDDDILKNLRPDNYGSYDVTQKISTILGFIADKKELAKKFLQIIPLFYDNNEILWKWNPYRCCYEIIDTTTFFNCIRACADNNVINAKERVELFNAITMESRLREPKALLPYQIQIGKELLDLKTGDRKIAKFDMFCKNPLPYKRGDGRDIDKWIKLFSQWVKPSDVPLLFEIIAFSFVPEYFIERGFILRGDGSNGKSVYKKIMRNVLGVYNVVSTDLDVLLSSRFEKSKLYGKLLCEIGETNLQKLENTQLLKRLMSGKDLIGGEFKNKPTFDFVNYAKIVIATNNIPPTEDTSKGFYRRWQIVKFPNIFTEEKDILEQFDEKDYENLTEKCIDVLMDLFTKRKFTNEGTFETREKEYEESSNPFNKFICEFIVESSNENFITKNDFVKKLNNWMSENRYRTLSDVSVNKLMKEKGFFDGRAYIDWFDGNIKTSRQVWVWNAIKWK